jgi:hypothetical protein
MKWLTALKLLGLRRKDFRRRKVSAWAAQGFEKFATR